MVMGAVKGQAATLQVEMVCLDELVPADDKLRELLWVAAVRVDVRRFLGCGFSERLPVH